MCPLAFIFPCSAAVDSINFGAIIDLLGNGFYDDHRTAGLDCPRQTTSLIQMLLKNKRTLRIRIRVTKYKLSITGRAGATDGSRPKRTLRLCLLQRLDGKFNTVNSIEYKNAICQQKQFFYKIQF